MNEISKLFEECLEQNLEGLIVMGWRDNPNGTSTLLINETDSIGPRYDVIIALLEWALERYRAELPTENDSIH